MVLTLCITQGGINSATDALSSEVFAIPYSSTTIAFGFADKITSCIYNIHGRILHKSGDGNHTLIVGAHRIRVGIRTTEILLRGRSVTLVRSITFSFTNK